MATVEITGLKEVARGFRNLDKQTRRVLPRKLKAVATAVADAARRKVPVVSGKAAESIKAASDSSSASVIGGKGSVKYYGWLDFGSRSPRSGNTRSEGPWRGSGTGPHLGRFIYPAIAEKHAEIGQAALDAVEAAAKEVGFH